MTTEGVLLAGGASRRMGKNKAALVLGEERVWERLQRVIRPLVSRFRVIGRSGEGAPSDHEPDLLPGLGPLGGIYTALATARDESEAVLVVGCDLPFVSEALLRALLEAARSDPDADAVVPWPERGPVPVCAVYRTRCAPALRVRLEARELRATDFIASDSLNVRRVGPSALAVLDPSGRSLFNMNRPSDYEAAVDILAREAASDGS